MPARKIPILQRFWSKVQKSDVPGECWEWTGYRDRDGYGTLQREGGTGLHKAHRFSFEIHKGPIPAGKYVCHSCDNPACVNPDHLWAGTNLDNIADRDGKGRVAHNAGTRCGHAKLTMRQVEQIRAFYQTGLVTHAELSRMFGISPSNIGEIIKGNHYK